MKTPLTPIAPIYFIIVLFILFSCSKSVEDQYSPFQFLTPDTKVVIHMHRPEVFFSSIKDHPVFSSIKPTDLYKYIARDIEMLRLLAGDSCIRYSSEKPLVAGLVLTGAKEYGWIFFTQLFGELTLSVDSSLYSISSHLYEGEIVYEITSAVSNGFFLAQSGNICLISRHKVLIEEALRTKKGSHSLEEVPAFKEIFKTVNKKDPFNVLINLKEFSELTNVLLPSYKKKWLSQLGQWAAMDVDISEPIIRLDGLIQVPDSQGHFLSVLAQNTPVEKKLSHLPIPQFVNAFVHVNLGNYATFYRKYTEYLDQNNKLIKHQKLWENDLKAFPKGTIQDHLKGEFGIFFINQVNDLSRVFYFRTTNASKTSELLQLSNTNKQPLSYRGYSIYEISNFKILNALFANFLNEMNAGFYTAIGDFIVLAETEVILYNCINAWEESSLLTKDKEFEKFTAKSSHTGHLIAYSKKSHFQKFLLHQLTKKNDKLLQLLEQFGDQNQSLLQVSFLNQNAYISFVHANESTDNQLLRQLWTLRTSDISYGPVTVTNHVNQSDEILYQDTKGTLYVLSVDGTTLWKKQLDAPIIYSTQWDMYKNSRLQHLLVTQHSIYVLDRNGNDVKPWPIHMKGSITAAALMDYEKNKNYRLIVGEGTTLHNLDTEARPVKGWQLTKLSAALAYKPTHYSFKDRDYLLFQLQDGAILVTDRTGVSRLKTNAYPYKTQNKVKLIFPTDDKPWFVTLTKSNGEQVNIFQNGTLDSIKIFQGAEFGYLQHEDDFLGYSYGNKVVVSDFKTFFESRLPFNPTYAPIRLEVEESVVYAVVSSVDEKVALIGSNGKMIDGFPVYGSAPPIFVRTTSNEEILLLTQSNQGHLIAYGINKKLFIKS